jgi:predicted transcriptional regulator
MLNERSRKVAHMMLKGYSVQEIASTLDVTKSVAGEIITSIRRYIAWCMVKQNLSAEPVISDSDLMDLAEEHERANVTKWR